MIAKQYLTNCLSCDTFIYIHFLRKSRSHHYFTGNTWKFIFNLWLQEIFSREEKLINLLTLPIGKHKEGFIIKKVFHNYTVQNPKSSGEK